MQETMSSGSDLGQRIGDPGSSPAVPVLRKSDTKYSLSPGAVGEEKKAISEQRKEKNRRSTNRLMLEGILNETQSRALRTSNVCIDPLSLRGRCLSLVRANSFTYVVSLVVIVNAVFIGFETELLRCDDGDVKYSIWYAIQVVFAVIFLAELTIRLAAERSAFWFDAWNTFDSVLVLVSALDTLVLHHFMGGSSVDLIVALRIMRLARLVRIFRLLRFFKELWFLVAGIFDATRTLAWAWLLLCFMTYIPAIFATRMFGQKYENNEYLQEHFSTIPRSMYTLFTVLTMEGWADIARTTMQVEPWSWLFFILFIFATSFAIMHVVVAVIVQNTLEHASHCKEEERQTKEQRERLVLAKIVEVFEVADADGDGDLTRIEFLQSLSSARVVRHLHEIGVDVRQAENLFDILDYDGSGCLDLCEFVEGVLRAKGEAKAKDILAVQCDMWRVESRLLDKVDDFSSSIQSEFGASGLQGALQRLKQEIVLQPLSPPKVDSRSSSPPHADPRMLKLRITVFGARGLRNADWRTISDPYCICQITGRPGSCFRTAIVKDNLDPDWDHTDDINEFAFEDELQFTVMDKDMIKSDDFLGRAVLKSTQIYPRGFEGELGLRDLERRSLAGSLRVRVVVMF